MAEKIRCSTCGYMLDPGAQFCPMCFSPVGGSRPPVGPGPVGPGPVSGGGSQTGSMGSYDGQGGAAPVSSGGSGKLVAVIIGVAVEALAVIALIILAIVGVKNAKEASSKPHKPGSSTSTTTPAATTPVAPIPQWTPELEAYMQNAAPGTDVSVTYNVDKFCDALYEANIVPGSYNSFSQPQYGQDFGGSYPSNLFCYVAEQNNISEPLSYGTLGYQLSFAANDGSILRYEYITGAGSDAEELADMIMDDEGMRLYAASDARQKTMDSGVARVLIKGTDPDNNSLAVVELFKIEGSQILKMTFEYPASNDYTETQREQYVAECLVRSCDFSGETKGCRSFTDFQNGNDVQ